MFKKILIILILFVLVGGGYVYYLSNQQPSDIFISSPDITLQSATGDLLDITIPSSFPALVTYSPTPNTVLGWKATKPGGFHTGTILVSTGNITLNSSSSKIIGGFFSFDMQTIQVLDIDDTVFESKIKEEFFNATTYPESSFTITTVEDTNTGLMIAGDLKIKNQTHPISFPATITITNSNLSVQASFAIDRLVRGLTTREGIVNNYIEYTIDMDFSINP